MLIFNCFEVALVVVIKTLGLLELVSDNEVFIEGDGLFVGGDGLTELEHLDQGEAFPAVGLREIALNVDA